MWPTAVKLHTKLYGSKEEPEKTVTYTRNLADWTLSVAIGGGGGGGGVKGGGGREEEKKGKREKRNKQTESRKQTN